MPPLSFPPMNGYMQNQGLTSGRNHDSSLLNFSTKPEGFTGNLTFLFDDSSNQTIPEPGGWTASPIQSLYPYVNNPTPPQSGKYSYTAKAPPNSPNSFFSPTQNTQLQSTPSKPIKDNNFWKNFCETQGFSEYKAKRPLFY